MDKKILIVEDDEDFISILKIKFTSSGFSVVVASNGKEGIIKTGEEKPDLIISDVLMPGMDGLEMAKKIRETNKIVPIVFLTNIKDAAYTNDIQKSGEFDYLVKSDLRLDDIIDRVKTKLSLT